MAFEIGAVRASASLDAAGIETGVKNARSALRTLEGRFQETTREAVRSAENMSRAWDGSFKKTTTAAQGQIDALTGVERASKNASATARAWAAQLGQQAKSFDRLRASVDPLFASSKQYEAAVEKAEIAVRSGIVSQAEANRVLEQAAQKYMGLVPAAQQAAEAQERAAQEAQRMRSAYEATRASIDPLYASSRRYEAVLDQTNGALAAGAISQREANSLLSMAEQQYLGTGNAAAIYGKQAKTATHHTANLSYQFNDIAMMMAAGQNPFMLAMQQGTQVSQVLNQMGGGAASVRALGGAFLSIINPVSLVTLGVIAGGAALFQWGMGALGAKRDADALKDTLSGLNETMRAYQDAAQSGADASRYIAENFGAVNDETIALATQMQNLRIREVMLDATEATQVLANTFSGGLRSELVRIEKLLGANWLDDESISAKRFAASLDEVRQAASVDDQLSAVKSLRTHFENATGGVERMSKEQREFYRDLLETEASLSRAVNLTDDAVGALQAAEQAARGLASAIASAAGYSANLDSGVRILEAEVLALKSGADAAIASNLEAKRIRAENMREAQIAAGQDRLIADAQLALDLATIEQQGVLLEQKKSLVKASRKAGSASAAASKNSLAGLKAELSQRQKLLSLSGDQRKKYEALITVQQRLGKEAGKVSKTQIDFLADQLVQLDETEERMQRVKDLQAQWSQEITRTAFEGGSLGDTVKGMLRDIAYQFAHSKIILPVVASVTGILGLDQLLFSSGGGAAQTAGSAGGGGLLGSAANLLGGGGGMLSGVASGLGGVLSGGGLGSSFANLGGMISGASGITGGAIGAALPAIGLIVGAAALLKKGFSREHRGGGITAAFSNDGLDWGHNFDFYKGGWARSDKWVNSPLSQEMSEGLDGAMKAMTAGVVSMAETLNLGTEALEDTGSAMFSIWTNGKTQEQVQAEIQAQIVRTGERMADLILVNDDYLRSGESHLDALERMATGLLTVNDAMDLLGRAAFEASLAGGDAASHLVDAFGGAAEMAAASNVYFAAFYSAQEQADTLRRRALERLTEEFGDLGLALPRSRSEFRALVEAADLTTEAGQALYAELLGLSGAMDQVLPRVSAYTEAMQGMVAEIGGEIGVQVSAARDMARISEQSARLWYRTASTLRDFLSDLLNTDLTAASRSQAAAVNRSRFETAFDMARDGDVEAARDIPGLAKAYLASARENATSSLEYRRIAAAVQGQVQFLAGIAELEGANDDVLRGLYEQQIGVLTGLGEFLQLEGLTADQVGQLSDGVQALAEDWDGTVEAFEGSLGALRDAIENAEAFSYDDLVGRLDVAVALDDNAPAWLRRLVDRADTGIRTTLDFVIRRDDLSAADRWIATNAVSEHVAAMSIDLRGGSRRALEQLSAIRDLVGSTGNITFDGGIELTFDQAFAGLSDGVRDLVAPLDGLQDALAELRAEVQADREQRAVAQQIASAQIAGAAAVDSLNEMSGQSVIDQIRALERSTGVNLGRGHTLEVGEDGRIQYSAESVEISAGDNLAAWRAGFWADGGLEDQIFAHNRSRSQTQRQVDRLRQQIENLGGIPAFASGTSFAPGGRALVGELGPEVVDLPRGSTVHPYSQSRAMLDNGDVVAELRGLRREVAELRDDNQQLMLANIKHAKRGSDALTRFERDPGSLTVTQVAE